MPCYEYKCQSCKRLIDVTRPMLNRHDPVECPICGDYADLVMSRVSFPHSQKAWSGRKHVNFEVDDRREIARKQVALTVNSGRFDGYMEKTKRPRGAKRGYLKALEKMMKKAPPIKVDY